MRKYILFNTLFFLTLLSLTFLRFSFASSSEVNPKTIDEQAIKFVENKQVMTSKMVDESKKKEIKSLVGVINSMCGRFENNVDILSAGSCTAKDSNGNIVKFEVFHGNGSYVFKKTIQQQITIQQTPTSVSMQATPNVPSQSAVSTGRWLKIFAGIVYAILTVYLFTVAVSNLFRREIIFLVVDLSLWATLTAAMYVVIGGL